MLYRVHGIRLRYNKDSFQYLRTCIVQLLQINDKDLLFFKIVRRSIDARKKPVSIIYSVDIETAHKLSRKELEPVTEKTIVQIVPGKKPGKKNPIIVGAGPAGLFAGFILAKYGYKPIILERGSDVQGRNRALDNFKKTRKPNPNCNALFGLGGAGTFSDGKLTTSLSHPLIGYILEVLVECGAPEQILTDAKPHIGTDILQNVVNNLANKIVNLGGTIKTDLTVTNIIAKNGQITNVKTSDGNFETDTLIVATGHSARDTWKFLEAAGVEIAPKPFQLGVRVEHPQTWLDKQQYGEGANHPSLGASDYRVSTKINNTPVFSFCMCPGGWTMPTVNEPGHLCINGMSLHKREGRFSSSGIVVTLEPTVYKGKDLDSCLSFVRGIEAKCYEKGGSDYSAPAQTLAGLLKGQIDKTLPESSYRFGLTPASLDDLFPDFVIGKIKKALPIFNQKLPGFIQDAALAIAPEARASSPIRIVRDSDTRQSTTIKGLYPAGEGSGYAGGIMSAALDGLKTGIKIIEKFAPTSSY
ncbi:MAG: FAD-dependent monooxygenase [Candidatus Thermoplasmatota archaeon]|nr:FAD-dependent monooxygenase [Candidatus Thermoplasmatota archaeon]